MRLKLDENLGRASVDRCRAAGHDVASVVDQGLAGSTDLTVFEACILERRALDRLLVTLERADITGRLWIVRKDRVRQYEPE